MGNWNDVLALVEAQLKAKGISPAAASRIATGHPYLVYSLRKGVNPTYDTLKALCDALGLEFYVGPPRNAGDPAWSSTIEKMTEALGLPAATGVDEVIEKIKSLNRWDPAALKAYLDETEVALQKWQSETIDAVAEIVKQMKATGPGTSVAQAAQAVQAGKVETGEVVTPPAQDLEDDKALAHPGLGQVVEFPDARDAGAHEQDPTALCSHGFRPLPRRGAKLAAGYGAFIESEPVIGHLAFREDWLLKHGINHEKADIVEVMGNSMEPTLSDGSLVLVDYQRTRRRSNRIFVVRSDDLVLIKRLVKDSHGEWLLVSDNDKEYKPVRWPQEAEVIGQVMWTARTL